MPSAHLRPLLSTSPAAAPQHHRLALAALLIAALAAPVLLWQPGPVGAWDTEAFDEVSEVDLVGLTNRTRVAAGLEPLAIDPALVQLARWRSRDMIDRQFFSHSIPGAASVFEELSERGYCFRLAGENIGWNTWADADATAGIHTMFLDSPGHRRNVVGTAWDAIGVGAYKGEDGRKMWTVLFADACGGPSSQPEPAQPEPPATRSTVGTMSDGSRAEPTGQIAASAARAEAIRSTAAVLQLVERVGSLALRMLTRLLADATEGVAAR